MAKKMLIKAQISRANRWKIDYKIFFGDSEDRKRQEFGLNEIDDLAIREQVALRICDFLENFDFTKILPSEQGNTPVASLWDKVTDVLNSKLEYDRANTVDTYKSTIGKFLKWLKSNNYTRTPYTDFTKTDAKKFIDWLKKQKLAPRTRNNNLTQIRTVFNEIDPDNPNYKNPFSGIKKERVTGKNRRVFTAEERIVVAKWIEENDYWLFRALVLQFYCYIRPAEMNRLKFKGFNFTNGTITIETFEAKCWKERIVTIPTDVLHYFIDGVFNKQPTNYYVFGRVGNGSRREGDRMAPSLTPAREDRAYKKHRSVLIKLQKMGLLNDITGLTWYSWKDTGITKHVDCTTPMATRNQAGHSKFDMTLTYYQKKDVNKEYQDLKADLFE